MGGALEQRDALLGQSGWRLMLAHVRGLVVLGCLGHLQRLVLLHLRVSRSLDAGVFRTEDMRDIAEGTCGQRWSSDASVLLF